MESSSQKQRFNFPGFVLFALIDAVIFGAAFLAADHFSESLGQMKTIIVAGLCMLFVGSLLIYLTHAVSDPKTKRIMNVGYIPFVFGYLILTCELLVFDLTNFTGQTPAVSDYILILLTMVLTLIAFAAVYFALRPKSGSFRTEKEDKSSKKIEEAEKRITVLESEIKYFRNKFDALEKEKAERLEAEKIKIMEETLQKEEDTPEVIIEKEAAFFFTAAAEEKNEEPAEDDDEGFTTFEYIKENGKKNE